ncbi:unnamed protein product [Porites evermanni]|uniref:Cyclic nucleotide-binding domain-containing protein n=1 Tax=Porites evermanni TaxID=104178 RepID=A0ABN8S145_9CNID|nr:unnamed protein product [Porites evermanni]
MANVFDNKKDKKLINESWKEGTFPRKSFTRSLSEKDPPSSQKNSNRDKAMDPVELPICVSRINIDRESREKEAERFSRHLSSSLNQLTSIPQSDEPIPLKVRKTISNSDTELRGINFIAMNNERNSTMVNKPKLEQRNSSNQALMKGRKSFKRRASMPANYLRDYLSVNNIRKRAHFLGTSDTDGETLNKVKNAGRRRPIERFRKIVQLLSFLLKMKTSMDRKYRSQNATNVFAELDEEAVTGVDCDGVVFDPSNFKAVREVHLSQEAIHILSLSPGSRTEEQLQTALVALKTSVAAFGEYPLKMQRRLVSAGWYERFEAKRVIIRQGHKAENFYFILSGTAVVTLLVNDPVTREQRNTTVAVLGKGSSFGELALLHHKTRSATVLCKDEVSLLAVCREDFRDIFMSYEDGREPEHIRFLKSVPFLRDLPVDDLTTKHDVCIFHYFRRGVVIVKESKTKWIYVVKTGSCRVLTHLSKKTAKLNRSAVDQGKSKAILPVIPVDETDRRRALYTAAGDRVRPTAWSPEIKRPKTEPSLSSHKNRDLSLPALVGEPEKFKKVAKNVSWVARMSIIPREAKESEEHREKIERLHRRISSVDKNRNKTPLVSLIETPDLDQKGEQVVVQIELLKPKDQFGLSMILFDNPAVKCHLVSNGAECVLIKKSWFLQHANESTLRKLRNLIPPYPSQDTLEQKMQDQANWDSYKTQTINNLLDTLHL